MAYRVEIACDEHIGNDCSNHGPFQPAGSGDNAQQAARRAEGDARHKGWVRAKSYRWSCPACRATLEQRSHGCAFSQKKDSQLPRRPNQGLTLGCRR